MRRLAFASITALLLAACGSSIPSGSSSGSTGGGSSGTTGASSSSSSGSSGSSGSTGGGRTTTTLIVHYPVGAHALAVRGSATGLSWTQGAAMSGSADTFTLSVSDAASPFEWKPLLDDSTWARGPNYRANPGETVEIWPHFTTAQGRVVTLIPSFHSTVLNNDRTIYAYLPPSYDENPSATYPVVYMHDGQNLWAAMPQLAFGGNPWNVDTAFDQAAENGACSANGLVGWGAQPLGGTPTLCTGDADCASHQCRTFPEAIVIGVANTSDRIYEYTPTTDPGTPGGGGADLYLQMLVQELKPEVDGLLRTRTGAASTAMAGSSLGGLVTAYAGLKYPSVFGLLGELSPSTWWNSDVIVADVQATPAAPARPLVVYVDSGQGSADDELDTDQLASAYLSLGYVDGQNFRHVVQPNAQHNETYWAQRFPGAMQLLLGAR